MKNFIIIFLLVSSFQFSTSTEGEILINYDIRNNNNDDLQELENYETEVDPNDHVHIELWNKLNNLRIAERYSQVR
ncbi:unnamed protein product, partial [Rotaria sordida]